MIDQTNIGEWPVLMISTPAGPMPAARIGKQYSDEARRKASESNKGKKRSDETRRRLSLAGMGKKRSLESRAKQSAKTKGVPKSQAHKAAQSAAAKQRYDKATPDQCKKWNRAISEGIAAAGGNAGEKNGNFGNKLTAEQKQNISNGRKGKGLGNQNYKKRGPFSAEALAKMSVGGRKRWGQ